MFPGGCRPVHFVVIICVVFLDARYRLVAGGRQADSLPIQVVAFHSRDM